MKYRFYFTNQFKKDYRKLNTSDMQLVDDVIQKLLNGDTLDTKFRDHALVGNYKGFRDCHIKPDLVLIYKKSDEILLLTAVRIASHSELF